VCAAAHHAGASLGKVLRQVAGMAVSDARHVAPQFVAVALVPAASGCAG
jgi:hypothetical protein